MYGYAFNEGFLRIPEVDVSFVYKIERSRERKFSTYLKVITLTIPGNITRHVL